MKSYARIKSFNGKIPSTVTDGKWYEILRFDETAKDRKNGISFEFLNDLKFLTSRDEKNSRLLNGGSWEIIEGREIKYDLESYGTFNGRCLTPCHNYSSTKIGSLACQGCGYFIKLDKEKQIVVCGYPVEEPENPTWCKHPVECPIETRAEKNKAWCKCNCNSYKQPLTKTVTISENEIKNVGLLTRTTHIYGIKLENIKSIEMKVEI